LLPYDSPSFFLPPRLKLIVAQEVRNTPELLVCHGKHKGQARRRMQAPGQRAATEGMQGACMTEGESHAAPFLRHVRVTWVSLKKTEVSFRVKCE